MPAINKNELNPDWNQGDELPAMKLLAFVIEHPEGDIADFLCPEEDEDEVRRSIAQDDKWKDNR